MEDKSSESADKDASKSASQKGLSFSSSSSASFKSKKRKAGSQLDDLKFPELEEKLKEKDKGKDGPTAKKKSTNPAKKVKKEKKTLLSFGDDA